MYPAIFSRTYTAKNARDVLRSAAADGYGGVQFNLVCAGIASLPDNLPDGLAEEVAAQAKAANLRIAALSGTYNMAHPDPAVRIAARAGFANVVAAARRMGAPVVTLCTGSRDPFDMWKHHPENSTPAAWSDLRAELDHALQIAESARVKLAIEPEPGNVVCDAAAARQLLDEVRSEHLGMVLDAANLLSPESLPRQHAVMREAAALLGDSILLAHAKDIDASGEVVAAGEGAIDLQAFVSLLRSAGYDGALIGHGFAAAKAPAVAGFLSRLIERNP
jgi:sugar phosphate isomerase/epimerase